MLSDQFPVKTEKEEVLYQKGDLVTLGNGRVLTLVRVPVPTEGGEYSMMWGLFSVPSQEIYSHKYIDGKRWGLTENDILNGVWASNATNKPVSVAKKV